MITTSVKKTGLEAALDAQAELFGSPAPETIWQFGERSARTTLVFVPTFAELGFVYAPLLRGLRADGYRLVTYAPRVSASVEFGPAERALELGGVLDKLGIDAAHFVAWSDAGTVLHEFATRYPERVHSRTYVGTPLRYTLPLGLRTLSKVYRATNLYRIVPNAVSAWLVAALMGGRHLRSGELYREIIKLVDVSGYLKFSILSCLTYAGDPTAHGPALVVGGGRDRLVRPSAMQALARAISAEYVFLPAGDHFIPWTAADELVPMVRAFLERAANRRHSAGGRAEAAKRTQRESM